MKALVLILVLLAPTTVPQSYGKGGEENFLAFLSDELIPTIDQRYRTQPLRIILGHSQGGLFASYALTARPNVFQWYLVMDAPLAGFPEVKPIIEKTKKFIVADNHIRLVSVESLYGWKKDWTTLVEGAAKGFYGHSRSRKERTRQATYGPTYRLRTSTGMKSFLAVWERKTPDGATFVMTFETKDGVINSKCNVITPSGEQLEMPVARM